MVGLPFLKRCQICGAKEGLDRCITCGKLTCQLHIAGGRCHNCMTREALDSPVVVRAEPEKRGKRPIAGAQDRLLTRVKSGAQPSAILADLYLLMGGRPGSQRSTTLMGSLHLDQRNLQLLFDRQVARRINAATFIRLRSPGLGEVETRPFRNNTARRVAHDQSVRTVNLASRTLSGGPIQILGGDLLLRRVEIVGEVTCPICGAWREVCQCPRKPEGSMLASQYFRTLMTNRLRQREMGLRMEPKEKNRELQERIPRWLEALAEPEGIEDSSGT
jgi:hypothetical protein